VGRRGGPWYRMRIQAKKFDPGKATFSALRGTNQVTTLLKRARADGAYPAYCLYLCVDQRVKWPSSCPIVADNHPLLGCVLVDAYQVKRSLLNGGLTPEGLVKLGFPWRCLFCCMAPEADLA